MAESPRGAALWRRPILLVCVLASMALAGGSWQLAESMVSAESAMGDDREEGMTTSVVDRVEHVGSESEGRVPVSLRRHAQMYFLYRADAGFEERLRLLSEAKASERAVRLSFREFSGRILAVEGAPRKRRRRPSPAC